MKIKVIEKYRKGTHLRFFNTSDQYLKIMETRCIFFYVKIHRYSEIDIRMDRIKRKNLENKWRFESTRSRVVSSFLNLKNELCNRFHLPFYWDQGLIQARDLWIRLS